MRLITLPFLLITLFGCNNTKQDIFHTTDSLLSIKVNGKLEVESWTIDPKIRPDVYEVECKSIENKVTFLDSQDSISFNIKAEETINFTVLNNTKDSAFIQIVGVKPNYNFTPAYIKLKEGKTNIEIPEVSELANILVALHRDAEQDKNMIYSGNDYYKRAKDYFKPYLSHPMMDTIHKYIGDIRYVEDGKVSLFSNESYYYYYALKMNACTYEFKEDGTIANQGFIEEMARGWSPFDPFKDKDLIEDFAIKSNFQAFYKENEPYYKELLETYRTLNPIGKMQQWLDQKFGFSYGNYTVYFSPLVSGAHSTKSFDTENFKQTFMFIACAEFNEDYSITMNELMESRVVFTELDHNYVDIVTEEYVDKIDRIFSDRNNWSIEELTDAYPTPSKIFNEYMTFGVYSLYVYDNYEEKYLQEFLPIMEKQMEDVRGFTKFRAFNKALLDFYRKNPNQTMQTYFEFILNWSQNI